MSHRNVSQSAAPHARHAHTYLLWLAVLAIGVVVLLGSRTTSEAKDRPGGVDIAYVLVFGDGPISRAWYDGAPSPGVPVQDALDHFSQEGYHVVRTSDALRQTNAPNDTSFAILLERPR